jgi:hypothetical protein
MYTVTNSKNDTSTTVISATAFGAFAKSPNAPPLVLSMYDTLA